METISRKSKSLGRKEKVAELDQIYKQFQRQDDHALHLILANSEAKVQLRDGIVSVTTALLRVLLMPFAVMILTVLVFYSLLGVNRSTTFGQVGGFHVVHFPPGLLTNGSVWLFELLFCLIALILLIYFLLLLGQFSNYYTKRRIQIIRYILEQRKQETLTH